MRWSDSVGFVSGNMCRMVWVCAVGGGGWVGVWGNLGDVVGRGETEWDGCVWVYRLLLVTWRGRGLQ